MIRGTRVRRGIVERDIIVGGGGGGEGGGEGEECRKCRKEEVRSVLTIETTGGGGFPFLSAPVCWLAAGFRLSLDCCMGSG